MTNKTRNIHARVQCIGGDEIKKFTPVEQIPVVGSAINATKYFHGKSRRVELSKIQRTKDDRLQSSYDFYITTAVDDKGNSVGEVCYCVPHASAQQPTREMLMIFMGEARKYDDVEKFVSDAMKSPVWEEKDVSNVGKEDWLRSLYKGANIKFEDLLKEYGISQAQFRRDFGIPKRTVENWIYIRQPHLYMMALLEEYLGMISCEV